MKTNASRNPILEQMVTRLVAEFQPERIYLFGSRARGDEQTGSDYDIAVIMPGEVEADYRLSQRAHEILWGIPASKDVFFMSRAVFERKKLVIGSLAHIVYEQGQELYAA